MRVALFFDIARRRTVDLRALAAAQKKQEDRSINR
jgi:hypothetical protein